MPAPDPFYTFFNTVYPPAPPLPYGYIQYKGTDLCADLQCVCGNADHIDGTFAYFYRCSACGRCYALDHTIKLLPLTDEQAAYAATRHAFRTDVLS